jgi:hypothetical protein
MTVTRNEHTQPAREAALELVPGLAEDFAAASAAFVAACGGNTVLSLPGLPASGLPAVPGPRSRP